MPGMHGIKGREDVWVQYCHVVVNVHIRNTADTLRRLGATACGLLFDTGKSRTWWYGYGFKCLYYCSPSIQRHHTALGRDSSRRLSCVCVFPERAARQPKHTNNPPSKKISRQETLNQSSNQNEKRNKNKRHQRPAHNTKISIATSSVVCSTWMQINSKYNQLSCSPPC